MESRAGGRPGQRVLALSGRLGLETVPEFLHSVRKVAEPALILDFTGISYMDSAGVGALIQTCAACQKANRRLALAALSDRMVAVLQITRVDRLFSRYATVAEAERSLAS